MIGVVLGLVLGLLSPTGSGSLDIRPCRYEDSRNCVWDARHMGNGAGQSFIDIDGQTYRISHRLAHRLIN